MNKFFSNVFLAIGHFFERKLFATILTMAILVWSFIVGSLPVEPFLVSALIVFIAYLFFQGSIDVSQINIDIPSLHITGDTPSAIANDHGFASRKFWTSMIMLLVMGYLGCIQKLFVTKEWYYAGTIVILYFSWVFIQGNLDLKNLALATKGFSIKPLIPSTTSAPAVSQPVPLPPEVAASVSSQIQAAQQDVPPVVVQPDTTVDATPPADPVPPVVVPGQ